jgi:DNA-binding MarR family transcriptional regulator
VTAVGADATRTWLAGQVGEHDATTALLMLWTARLGQLNDQLLEEQARQGGRTAAEDRVLVALLLVGPPHQMSPTRLREALVQSSGGMTKTLRRLEHVGLVRRAADPADGRGLLAELTSSGRRAAQEALDGHVRRYDHLLADLDVERREQVLAAVRTVLDLLETELGARPSGSESPPRPPD